LSAIFPGNRPLFELVGLPHVEEGGALRLLGLLRRDLADLGFRSPQKFAEIRHVLLLNVLRP
jgi:hypothetical protein